LARRTYRLQRAYAVTVSVLEPPRLLSETTPTTVQVVVLLGYDDCIVARAC
jgi:hypothetical protein